MVFPSRIAGPEEYIEYLREPKIPQTLEESHKRWETWSPTMRLIQMNAFNDLALFVGQCRKRRFPEEVPIFKRQYECLVGIPFDMRRIIHKNLKQLFDEQAKDRAVSEKAS